jgi:hypothetical protein
MLLMPKGKRDLECSTSVQADRVELLVPAQLRGIKSWEVWQRLRGWVQAEDMDKLACLGAEAMSMKCKSYDANGGHLLDQGQNTVN